MVYPLLADPLERGWTALQAWDPGGGRRRAAGVPAGLRARRQRRIALENVPAGRTFELVSGPDGAVVGTVTSEELRAGIDVRIPEERGARCC